MRVAAVVLYGNAVWVCPLAGEAHVAVGVRVQATCAGWSGGTVLTQGESHACWSAVAAAVGVW